MCLGIPMGVVEIAGLTAICDADGGRETVDIALIDGALRPGDFVLVHRGRALRQLDAAEAAAIGDALKALSMANRGQPFDHLLSDLIGREPLLPEHLRPSVKARP